MRVILALALTAFMLSLAAARPPDYKALNADLASGVVAVVRGALNCGPYLDANTLCKLMLTTPPLSYNVRFQSTFSAYFAVALRTASSETPLCKVWAQTRIDVHALLARLLKKHPIPGVFLPPLQLRALELGEEHCTEFEMPPLGSAQLAALRMISKFYSTAPTR